MSDHPPIMLVDMSDNPIGSAPLDEVHYNGLMHRIVVVMVLNHSGQILLQKRAMWVATHPGLWDASAAGHVDKGESYEQAAKRELKEELGLSNIELKQIDKIESRTVYKDRKLNRFKMIYEVIIPDDSTINYDKDELLAIKWYTKKELEELIENEPNQLVPDFRKLLEKYFL